MRGTMMLCAAAAAVFVLLSQPAKAQRLVDNDLRFSINFDGKPSASGGERSKAGEVCNTFTAISRGFKESLMVCIFLQRYGTEDLSLDSLMEQWKKNFNLEVSANSVAGFKGRSFSGTTIVYEEDMVGGWIWGQAVVAPDGQGCRLYMAVFAQTGPTSGRGFKKLLDEAYDFKGSLTVWAGPASAATLAAPLSGSGPSASTPTSGPSDSLAELNPPATLVLSFSAVAVVGQPNSVAGAYKVYTSPDGVFRFQYPARLELHSVLNTSGAECPGNLVCVEWPSDYVYKGYDFAGAQFWVGTAMELEGVAESSKRVTSEKDCLAFHGYSGQVGRTVINGVRFATRSWTEGAAGTLAEFCLFRTFYNGVCYELGTKISVANGGYTDEDYALGRVKRFTKADNARVKRVLNSIVNSFRFLK